MYELVVIYSMPHETAVFQYNTEEQAKKAEAGMRMALGNQIEWSCVRPKMN